MISKPMVCSSQTVHISCVEINNISKCTKTRFHFTHATYEVHRVWPKRFPCSWYIWRKPYTYLALKLTPSRNRPKRAFTSPTSPWSSIGCSQNIFWVYCTFGANRAPILRDFLQNGPKRASIWPKSPRSSIGCAQNDFHAYGMFVPNHAPILHRD
jgi:hypothetical protein